MSFKHIKVGDVVARNFCGRIQKMKVSEVDKHRIIAGLGWAFDPETGWEIDDCLEWGPRYGKTGSYLVKELH